MAKKSFEQSLSKLEEIVNKLESTDIPLEKALKLFEEGVKLSNFCSETLDETDKKITILMENRNGNSVEKPFITDNEIQK